VERAGEERVVIHLAALVCLVHLCAPIVVGSLIRYVVEITLLGRSVLALLIMGVFTFIVG
jgi:hypothetical protein